MQKICLLVNWFFVRPWPVWITILLMVLVLVAGLLFRQYWRTIFAAGGALMQGLGVFILIFILNQNMAILKGGSLVSEIKQWQSEYPLTKKSFQLAIDDAVVGTAIDTITLRRQADTLEEKIEILEEEIKLIKGEAIENRNTLKKEIDAIRACINDVDAKVSNISEKLEDTVIGDFRWPIFSTLIILAGLFVSFFPLLINK